MQGGRRSVLSIAGFDPSGGAGVLADIKAFEEAGVQGFGIATSVTYQNDVAFEGLDWLEPEQIIKQYDVLSARFRFGFVKVGLIKDLEMLEAIIDRVRQTDPGSKIIWDPILSASAGFVFHRNMDKQRLRDVLKKIYLLTPNRNEIIQLAGHEDTEAATAAKELSAWCNILLKGGHATGSADDLLLLKGGDTIVIKGERIEGEDKRGTGCVLSSAIAAYMAQGAGIEEASRSAKTYISNYIKSAPGKLGIHKGASAANHVHTY